MYQNPFFSSVSTTFVPHCSQRAGSVAWLPRTQVLRKGSWGGSLVPLQLRANRRKFSPPHEPLRSAWVMRQVAWVSREYPGGGAGKETSTSLCKVYTLLQYHFNVITVFSFVKTVFSFAYNCKIFNCKFWI